MTRFIMYLHRTDRATARSGVRALGTPEGRKATYVQVKGTRLANSRFRGHRSRWDARWPLIKGALLASPRL